jgi:hypothetical protein
MSNSCFQMKVSIVDIFWKFPPMLGYQEIQKLLRNSLYKELPMALFFGPGRASCNPQCDFSHLDSIRVPKTAPSPSYSIAWPNLRQICTRASVLLVCSGALSGPSPPSKTFSNFASSLSSFECKAYLLGETKESNFQIQSAPQANKEICKVTTMCAPHDGH